MTGKFSRQITVNYEAFIDQLDSLEVLHHGEFALMHDGEILEFYSSWENAYKTGVLMHGKGHFSVQEVTKTPVDLGFYSHVARR